MTTSGRRSLQHFYAALSVVGAVLPLTQFAPWLVANGLAVPLLLLQAFATPVSAFAWTDVLVSAAVVVVFVVAEGRRLRMRLTWIPLLALVSVGVSLALPLFLWLRERHLAAATTHDATGAADPP